MIFLSLEHNDDALSVLLQASEDSDDSAESARRWSRLTGCPLLIADSEGRLRNPASVRSGKVASPRRKRRSALRNRRTVFRLRAERVNRSIDPAVYSEEREIIARN